MQESGASKSAIQRAAAGLAALEVDPFELLQVQRIGVDQQATEWLRARWRGRHYGRESWAALSKRCHGQVVLELTEPQEALPLVSGMVAGPLDFRGKQLQFTEDLIGEVLVQEAWEHHSARKMIDYANRLERRLRRCERNKKNKDLIAIVEGAARWLRFWGERGFSYHAWF